MSQPLVTVLLCHHNMRDLVPIALASYLSQDYENLELVVVDSDREPIEDLVRDIPNCRYSYIKADRLSIKRNFGVRESKGELIVHFDADDWSGPNRVSDQVRMLGDAQVGGYSQAFWYDYMATRASLYRGDLWQANLIYRRDYALAYPWDERCFYAEEWPFLAPVRNRKGTVPTGDAGANFVATVSDRNERRTAMGASERWRWAHIGELPSGFRQAVGLA